MCDTSSVVAAIKFRQVGVARKPKPDDNALRSVKTYF